MSFIALLGSVEQGLIYGLVALGLFVSFRILNIADLTVEGSFTTGAAVSSVVTVMGHPIIGIFLAILSGMGAGFLTGFIQTKLKIQSVLAGILVMTALYSINLQIMGKPNISLIRDNTIFDIFNFKYSNLVIILIIISIIAIFLLLFFKTTLGLSIRATGDNEHMVSASSINPTLMTILGLMLANSLVALSGGILAQYQSFADASMGIGVVVIGLASLVIGESIFGRKKISRDIFTIILGSIIYRMIIALAFKLLDTPANLKLISSIILIIAISSSTVKEGYNLMVKKRGAKNDRLN